MPDQIDIKKITPEYMAQIIESALDVIEGCDEFYLAGKRWNAMELCRDKIKQLLMLDALQKMVGSVSPQVQEEELSESDILNEIDVASNPWLYRIVKLQVDRGSSYWKQVKEVFLKKGGKLKNKEESCKISA